jgi:hypothetical protein
MELYKLAFAQSCTSLGPYKYPVPRHLQTSQGGMTIIVVIINSARSPSVRASQNVNESAVPETVLPNISAPVPMPVPLRFGGTGVRFMLVSTPNEHDGSY